MGAFPTGSPKELVKSVADGYVTFSVITLRKFQPHHFRMLLQNILIVEREIRAEILEENDFDGARKKNFRLQNLNRARMMINDFMKHRRIKVEE